MKTSAGEPAVTINPAKTQPDSIRIAAIPGLDVRAYGAADVA